ncbi:MULTISPECIES: polymorphic toxin-type HINT domain-containing protein [unclassified Streptomyces]|uniref:polymorphic toxin-type HINT domain-containing protein n=1 Tax=unclassified Streptomyces TaxID=2593676 RepID=UPI0035DEA41F
MLPLALLSGLVSAAPAAAAEPVVSERGQVLAAWKGGGPATKAAAGVAMTGSDSDIRAFLEKGRAIAENLDDREAALQVVADAGPAVRKAAEAALAGTPKQLDTFLKEGWKAPLAQDQRVQAAAIGETGGRALHAAAEAALNSDIEAVREFLSEGQYRKRDSDARVRVAQLETAGGPKVRAGASAALNGSIEDVRDFLSFGQHVARAQDQEFASVTELAQQANEAGDAAERESKAAKESADKAITLARLAKEETQRAAAEAALAKKDADRAADAARRAAESTRKAAQAAQAAIAASRSANAAAQVAAAAAGAAANAAAGAARAATAALNSAANGKRDEMLSAQALKAAEAAESAANAADRAAIAGDASAAAARAAASSAANANATALAADEASGYAEEAGASSDEARAAAAAARRHAAEATRAANAAAGHAADAARQARAARDAARSAAQHARNAADAALKAGQYAAGSKEAALDAKKHADAALLRANEAVAAVAKAKDTHDLARKAEAEELAARKATGINHAKDAKAAYNATLAESKKAAAESDKLQDDFARLAQDAAQPAADGAVIAATGRKLALAALETQSDWSKAAAEGALASADNAVVVEYARVGWRSAFQQDERDQLRSLAQNSEHEAVVTGAEAALTGDAAQIHAYLEVGQYAAAASDLRVEVARIGEAGGPAVKSAAEKAINDIGYQPLLDFLTTIQYSARNSDNQVIVASLAENGGPEVKAYAEIALESPAPSRHAFIERGQYKAAQRDQANASHVAQIQHVIAGSAQVAALAQQRAAEALKTAAVALNASSDAEVYAQQAQTYAANAAGYAQQADASADQAEASAKKAAAHAATAREAQRQAQVSASNANASALWAEASAGLAREYAATAVAAAEAARQSAISAGKNSDQAAAIYQQHLDTYLAEQARAAERTWWEKAYGKYTQLRDAFGEAVDVGLEMGKSALVWWITATPDQKAKFYLEFGHFALDIIGLIPGYGEIADGINCAAYGIEGYVTDDNSKYIDAGLSCASMIPVAGYAAAVPKTIKWSKKAEKLFETLNNLRKRDIDLPNCLTPKHSFPAGTPVLMGDGTTRPIEQVRIGDMVQAADPTTGVSGPRRVQTTIHTPDDRDFTTVTLDAKAGGGTLTATGHHPFWAQNRGDWTAAADLKPGDTLRTPSGATAQVAKVSHWKKFQPAYDLTVNEVHSYYVLAKATPVLVHNCTDLIRAEKVDKRAHTIKEHVTVSTAEMKRLAKKKSDDQNGAPARNSRWKDLKTAQDAVDALVADPKNAEKIRKFVIKAGKGGPTELPLTGTYGTGSLGDAYDHLGNHIPDLSNRFTVVIVAKPGYKPGGYFIKTAYPE